MNPKAKILVIDDEEGIRDWLAFELSQQNYIVVTASNGPEGIAKIKKEKFDVAIIDIKMPGMDGVTVLGHIKKIDSFVEVIISTGYATMETAVESLRKGACNYISKPYNVDEITIAIENAIDKQQLVETIALYEMSKAILSTIDLDQLLDKISQLTMQALKSDDASLMLFNEKKQLYIATSSIHPGDDTKIKTTISVGERIAGWVAERKEPLLLIDGLEHDMRFKDLKDKRRDIRSSMVLPLIGKKNILGILNINRIHITEHFTENDLRKASIFASQIALAVENAYLFKEINALYLSTIRSLANAIDAKDTYTNRHSERVAELAVAIAGELNFSRADIEKIQQTAQIHDLGKIGIHDFIINKPGKLTEEEMEEMKSHPIKGAQILEPLGFLSDIIDLIKQHHEKYDGSGYPAGLKGEAIRIEARIIAVADAYEAMTTDRSYRKALTVEQAVAELTKHSGTQFDASVVAAFMKVLERQRDI